MLKTISYIWKHKSSIFDGWKNYLVLKVYKIWKKIG